MNPEHDRNPFTKEPRIRYRSEQRAARDLKEKEGIKYTEALRRVRQSNKAKGLLGKGGL